VLQADYRRQLRRDPVALLSSCNGTGGRFSLRSIGKPPGKPAPAFGDPRGPCVRPSLAAAGNDISCRDFEEQASSPHGRLAPGKAVNASAVLCTAGNHDSLGLKMPTSAEVAGRASHLTAEMTDRVAAVEAEPHLKRAWFIDHLRMLLCALVIIHHTAIAYGAMGGMVLYNAGVYTRGHAARPLHATRGESGVFHDPLFLHFRLLFT
jgi:hypothetical protein